MYLFIAIPYPLSLEISLHYDNTGNLDAETDFKGSMESSVSLNADGLLL
jgi:hypothetical protein